MKKCGFISINTFLGFVICLLLSFSASAQDTCPENLDECPTSDGERVPSIGWDRNPINENTIIFTVCCKPEFGEDASAEAFYQYFWDFGDGTYFVGTHVNSGDDGWNEADVVTHTYAGGPEGDTFRVTLEITKVYTSDKNGKAVLRVRSTTDPSVPGEVIPDYSTFGSDAYQLPASPEPITIRPVRDLVPSYLQSFVITYTEDCPDPGTQFKFTYPHNSMSFASDGFGGPLAYTISPANPMAWSSFHGDDNAGFTRINGDGGIVDTIVFLTNRGDGLGANNIRNTFISLYANPTLEVGETLEFGGGMTCPGVPDVTLEDNVSGSHDPNLKDVDIKYLYTDDATKLTYTVQFQNEGDFPENNIIVRDTLSEDLAFCTVKIKSAKIGSRKVWDVEHIPPFLRGLVPSNIPLCEVTKNPGTRSIEFNITQADLLGLEQQVIVETEKSAGPQKLSKDSTMIPETWGVIEYEVYTNCSFEFGEKIENKAWVTFGDQAPQSTDSAVTKKLCTRDLIVNVGQELTLDLLAIARQDIDPQYPLDPSSLVIAYSEGGISYPTTVGPNGTYLYKPTRRIAMTPTVNPNGGPLQVLQGQINPVAVKRPSLKWFQPPAPEPTLGPVYPTLPQGAYIDHLRYIICDTKGFCYQRSVNILVNVPDGYGAKAKCDSDTCQEADCVKDLLPFEKWILWLIMVFVVLFWLLRRVFKKKKRRPTPSRS